MEKLEIIEKYLETAEGVELKKLLRDWLIIKNN